MDKQRKVLKIVKGDYVNGEPQFLMEVHADSISTTHHIKYALDLNELTWDTIGEITEKLSGMGYRIRVVNYTPKG